MQNVVCWRPTVNGVRVSTQEKGTKWETGADMDGLTTNGVLIMHPNGCFSEGNAQPGIWREVSIGGAIYSLRISRSSPVKGSAVCVGIVRRRVNREYGFNVYFRWPLGGRSE